jgi:hypothetical protein
MIMTTIMTMQNMIMEKKLKAMITTTIMEKKLKVMITENTVTATIMENLTPTFGSIRNAQWNK